MTIEEFAKGILKPAAHRLVSEDARKAGLSEEETERLIELFDADPIGYAVLTRGDAGA